MDDVLTLPGDRLLIRIGCNIKLGSRRLNSSCGRGRSGRRVGRRSSERSLVGDFSIVQCSRSNLLHRDSIVEFESGRTGMQRSTASPHAQGNEGSVMRKWELPAVTYVLDAEGCGWGK
jgi:hypothetical protein